MLIEAGIPLKGHDDVQARIERILAFRAENGHWPFVRLRKGTKCQASRDYATIIRNKKHHDAAKAAGIPLEVDMRESIVVSKRLYQGIVAYKIGSVVSHVGARWHSEGRPNQKTAGKVIGDLSFKGLDSAIRDGMRGLGEDLERCHVRSISDLCDEIEANCWLFQVDGCRQKVLWSRVLADGLQIDVSTPATRTHFLIWKPPHPSRHKWTLHDHQ